VPAPATPRNDLVQVFLTGIPGLNQPAGVKASEMLRLNTDVLPTPNPNRLGALGGDIQGFPNGRRLTDDVLDITVQAAAGALVGEVPVLGRRRQKRRAVPHQLPVSRQPALGR